MTHGLRNRRFWTCWLISAVFAGTAGAGELLVDDFDDGNLEAPLGLAWMVIGDEMIGGASKGQLEIASIEETRAARLSGRLEVADGQRVAFLGAWTALGEDGGARDLSAYSGVRLRARAEEGSFQAALRRAGVNTSYAAPVELGSDWTDVDVPFSALRPLAPPGAEAPAWNASDVVWIGLTSAAADTAAVHVELDRISLYGGPDARRPPASPEPSVSTTTTAQLADATALGDLRWQSLTEDRSDDGRQARLPDATGLAWARSADGWIWFRFSLAEAPPAGWLGVNIALDVDGQKDNGTAWWGSNSAFQFDRLITAYLTRTERYWMGTMGVASDEDVGRGVMDSLGADVRAAVDRPGRALLVGVPRSTFPATGKVRLIGTVGSSMINNDDLPDSGAVELELPPES